MDFFEHLNLQIASNPDMLMQLETALRFKFWGLLLLAIYFVSLPLREQKKQKNKLEEHAIKHNGKDGKFIA
ncbi:MAG: hypothetical protein GQ569_10795 [Methylococcaceae bacterium]|nr:hypothetical protein [Methylococcaceae bacterium]